MRSFTSSRPWWSWSRTCRALATDRKSTRLNSSHLVISYAVFCLKKKKLCQLPAKILFPNHLHLLGVPRVRCASVRIGVLLGRIQHHPRPPLCRSFNHHVVGAVVQ